jgi:PilZ domain-containing protein
VALPITGPVSIERRNFFRVPARVPLTASRITPEGPDLSCDMLNLSAGGVCVFCAEVLTVGDRISVHLDLHDPDIDVWVDAMVVNVLPRSQGQAYGLRFEGANARTEQQVIQWVFAEERRVAQRNAALQLSVRIPVDVGLASGRRISGTTWAICQDEVHVVVREPIGVGDLLDAEIGDEESGFTLAAQLEVVDVTEGQSGGFLLVGEFIRLDVASRRALTAFIVAEHRKAAEAA